MSSRVVLAAIMPTERLQVRIDPLIDQTEGVADGRGWSVVAEVTAVELRPDTRVDHDMVYAVTMTEGFDASGSNTRPRQWITSTATYISSAFAFNTARWS